MKVTMFLIALVGLAAFGLLAVDQQRAVASAPEGATHESPVLEEAAAPADEDPRPTLLYRRTCYTGNLRVNNQNGNDWIDLACLNLDSSQVFWLYQCGPVPERYTQQKITLSGFVAATCWEKVPNPEP